MDEEWHDTSHPDQLLAELLELVPHDKQARAKEILSQVRGIRHSLEDSEAESSQLNYFLDRAKIGLWKWDMTINRVRYSKSWCRRIGMDPTKNSHSAEECQSRVYPGDREALEQLITEAVRTNSQNYEAQFRYKFEDGGWHWIVSKGFVVTDGEGNLVGMKGIHIDITETKEAMRTLQFSRIALDEANSKIFWIDQAGQFIYANLQAADWLGVSQEAAEQMSVFDNTELTPETWAERIRMLQQERKVTFECKVKARGKFRPVEIHATLVSYEDEDVLVGMLLDTTDRLAMEASRETQSKELLHVTRLTTMGEMSAKLSHELAQPISAIANFAAAARHYIQELKLEDTTLATVVDDLADQSERTAQVLRRVRQFTKHKELFQQSCELDEIVNDSLAMMRHDLADCSIEVACDFRSQAACVSVDRVQIQQVIINLLQNARDAMEDVKKQARRISISTEAVNQSVILRIQDTGIGIPRDDDEQLFEMFYTTKDNGAGIGLAICRSIVNSHNGTLTIANHADGGVVVTVELPLESMNCAVHTET